MEPNEKYAELIAKCREIVECDTARISHPAGKMFLIIGFNRNTRDDLGQWTDGEGNPKPDWDYVREEAVANGATEEELLASVREYAKISKMSMGEYLLYRAGKA